MGIVDGIPAFECLHPPQPAGSVPKHSQHNERTGGECSPTERKLACVDDWSDEALLVGA